MRLKPVSFICLIFLCLLVTTSVALSQHPASPESVGVSSEKLQSVHEAVNKMIEQEKIAGAVVMVARRGQVVHFEAQGMRDVAEQAPMKKDTIFRIYSMTKPVTTVAAMMLYEQGKLELDAPVEKYIEEFKGVEVYKKGRRVPVEKKPTIRDLMRHTSGLTYGFFGNTPVDKMYTKNHPLFSQDNGEMIQKLMEHPLLHQPGKTWHYSMSTDVLGYVVEQVSGESLASFFQAHIFEPLQMEDTAFYVPQEKKARFASSYGPKVELVEAYHSSHFLNKDQIQSGGGGLVSTAADYMKFCQMLLNKGLYEERRLLKASTLEQMTRNQLPDGVYAYGLFGFGLGFQIQLQDWGSKGHLGEYGWSGAASTHFWISPADDLVGITLSQRQPFSNTLKRTVKPLVYDALLP